MTSSRKRGRSEVRSSPICIDASLVVRLLVNLPETTDVRPLWLRWKAARTPLVAPALIYFEVANAIYQYEKQGLFGREATDAALEAALSLPVSLAGETTLHHRAVEMARRYSLPASYDANYLALAERLGAELWTCDRRLAGRVQQHCPWVRL